MSRSLPRAALFGALLIAATAAAQTPGVPVLISPEVLADRRVIVCFYAPHAHDVHIFFERGGDSLTKSEDGVWQATLGPLERVLIVPRERGRPQLGQLEELPSRVRTAVVPIAAFDLDLFRK